MVRLKEGLRLFFVALIMKMTLGSKKVLRYMHIAYQTIGFGKAQTVQGWPKSFPAGCNALDFALNNNASSSRTF